MGYWHPTTGLPEDMVPQGWPGELTLSLPQIRMGFCHPTAFAQHNETAEEPIRVRVGPNAGEPIAEEADLFGTAVIRAARIAAMAEGGEVLVANVVRELAEGKGFLF